MGLRDVKCLLNIFSIKNKYVMAKVIIYSTPTCGFCQMAKAYFKESNVEFTEKDVAMDEAARAEMLNKSQQMGVPVIDIDGTIIVGFDQPRIAAALGGLG